MTQRERHNPEAGVSPPAASVWEDWFRRATPGQQQNALALASSQGLLHAGQLPAPSNEPAAARPSLLAALLNGQLRDLPAVRLPETCAEDSELDADQRRAVAMALSTPDLALLQGYPGTGKSRVLAEIVRQSARQGLRVLVVAPTMAGVDRVLEQVGGHPAVLAIRCSADGEPIEALPACVRRLTFTERVRGFHEQALTAARRDLEEAQAAAAHLRALLPLGDRLDDLAGRYHELVLALNELAARRERVADEVAAEQEQEAGCLAPTRFQSEWAGRVRRRDEARARLEAEEAQLRADIEKLRAEERKLDEQIAPLRPMADALRRRRWWTAAWWRARFRGQLLARVEELEGGREERRVGAGKKEQEMADLAAAAAREDELLAKEGRLRAEAEALRRRAEIDAEAAARMAEQRIVLEQWWQAWTTLDLDTPTPEAPAPEAVRAARQRLSDRLAREEHREASARRWTEAVAGSADSLPSQLTRLANVVAASTGSLAADPHFGDRANPASGPTFDLLLLDEAHRVTESEFQALARRACRWVLVGEPAGIDGRGEALSTAPASRPAVRGALRPGFFHRLWRNLHADPRRLPYAWSRRADRLSCILRPVSAEQESWLEREAVADQPDVELRILTPPPTLHREPQVAEVLFPAAQPLNAAKTFIYRELQELAVCPAGRSLCWTEGPDRVVLNFGPPLIGSRAEETVAVVLEEGIREVADAENGCTWSLEFDRASGWRRERAEAWVAERLGLRDLGRTTLLTAVYRADRPLAAFLSQFFFGGLCQAVPGPTSEQAAGAAVEFVAVPSLAGVSHDSFTTSQANAFGSAFDDANGDRRGSVAVKAPRLRSIKGGAGLEADLADVRPLEQVPADIRAALPRHGLVNYLEARAVIQALEHLIDDPAFQEAAARWPSRHETRDSTQETAENAGAESGFCCGMSRVSCLVSTVSCQSPAVAVMALYPAQAELLRLLVHRSPVLAHAPCSIEVGLPTAFRQRECLAALVSLTRSHTHRAVTYGEGPNSLVEACTRASRWLLLFGDPATLARRSQWEGMLDHLDEGAAQAERGLAARLVACIQGHGPAACALRLREGGCV
jgi:hypothetical protein